MASGGHPQGLHWSCTLTRVPRAPSAPVFPDSGLFSKPSPPRWWRHLPSVPSLGALLGEGPLGLLRAPSGRHPCSFHQRRGRGQGHRTPVWVPEHPVTGSASPPPPHEGGAPLPPSARAEAEGSLSPRPRTGRETEVQRAQLRVHSWEQVKDRPGKPRTERGAVLLMLPFSPQSSSVFLQKQEGPSESLLLRHQGQSGPEELPSAAGTLGQRSLPR